MLFQDIRKDVLRGELARHSSLRTHWTPITGKLSVFFSSTFTDTHWARNILQNKTLKSLQAISDGVVISFVDMRFGVKDENTLDHQTWTACSKEIEMCRRESDGIFFVSLQGEK